MPKAIDFLPETFQHVLDTATAIYHGGSYTPTELPDSFLLAVYLDDEGKPTSTGPWVNHLIVLLVSYYVAEGKVFASFSPPEDTVLNPVQAEPGSIATQTEQWIPDPKQPAPPPNPAVNPVATKSPFSPTEFYANHGRN